MEAQKKSKPYKKLNNGKKRERKGVKAQERVDSPARLIAKREGQRGIDSRSQTVSAITEEEEFVSQATDVSIDQKVQYSDYSIQALAAGPVFLALKKGWLTQVGDGDDSSSSTPYHAYVKLYQSFLAAMQGTDMPLANAPDWYWHVTQALASKILPFKTGRISYEWNMEAGAETVVPSPGIEFIGGESTFYVPDYTAPLVNGFVPLEIPAGYTPELGGEAIDSLFKFYRSEGMTKLMATHPTIGLKTGSAFAVCGAELGSSGSNVSGVINTIYSATPLNVPLFSKFGVYQDTIFQGWQRIQLSGAGPCYVIPRMIEMSSPQELYNQACPQIKYYNFDEFYEVLSLTLGGALEIAANSQIGAPPAQCPLSPQQVKLLLRHTLMKKFCNHMVQDTSMNGQNVLVMSPLSCGVNGTSTTSTNMLLPLLLAENIRAASRKRIHPGSKTSRSVIDYIPVLARPIVFNEPGNYTYTSGLGTADVYATIPGEVPINILDLKWATSPSRYVTLEGEILTKLCTSWNAWIKSIASNLTPLTDPGTEKGLNVFGNILTTVHQKYIPTIPPINAAVAAPTLTKQASKKKFVGIDPDTFKVTKFGATTPSPATPSYFQEVYPFLITTTNTPLDPVLKYAKVLIAPSMIGDYAESVGSATIAANQSWRIEPYKISLTSLPASLSPLPPTQIQSFSRHMEMAQFDIRSSLQPISEIEADLEALAKEGRGGFFTSLAGMFAEDVLGIKGGKQIAGLVGQVTGW